MKHLLKWLISALLFTGLFAQSDQQLYVYVEKSFTPVPLNWVTDYKKTPYLFISYSPVESDADTFQENMNLVIEYLPREYTVAEYMKASTLQLKNVFLNFKILKSGPNFHIYEGKMGEIQLMQMQYCFMKNKAAYILTFSATPESFKNYEEIFNYVGKNFSLVK